MGLKRSVLVGRLPNKKFVAVACNLRPSVWRHDAITRDVLDATATDTLLDAGLQHIRNGLGRTRPLVRSHSWREWSWYDWDAIFDVRIKERLAGGVDNQIRAGSDAPVSVRVYLAFQLRQSLRGGR